MEKIERGTLGWEKFMGTQKLEIQSRLRRYNNVETVKEQLVEVGDVSPYQRYKIETVSGFLRTALHNIESEKGYGDCVVCRSEIPVERLILVPGALACVPCDNAKGEA
jgi:RNA polymerase-binding transcription factor DksA